MVGHENADAARRGHHTHVGIGRQATRNRAQVGDVQHLLDRAWPVGAALGKNRVEDRIVAGQRAGVRAGGRCPQLGTAHFHDQHRLAGIRGLQQGAAQTVAITTGLKRGADDTRGGVFGQVVDAFGHIHVGLVASGHDLAEAHAAQRGHAVRAGAEGTALRHERNRTRTRLQAVERGGESGEIAGLDVEQAQRVGTDHAHASVAAHCYQLVLQRPPFGSSLGEARGQHQHALDALREAVAQRRLHAGRRHHDDRLVDRVGNVAHAGVRRISLDFRRATLVDGIDPALEGRFKQEAEDAAADAVAVGRGADDSNRCGCKEGRQ